MPSSRDETLAILHGRHIGRLPVFSGLPSITLTSLHEAGVSYTEAHTNAHNMARAAASTFELYGFESAVVPFDLCVEAEALGCVVDFHADVQMLLAPVISQPFNLDEFHLEFDRSMSNAGRVPLVAEAIRELKRTVGQQVAVGACIAGPFTLAWQMFGAEQWLSSLGQKPRIEVLLEQNAEFLSLVAAYYCKAGADFITVHEMGGSPQAIGPATFRALVQPALQKLFARLPTPSVLSICGDTNAIVKALAACGAGALHVDQRNDLARTRCLLGGEVVLLGNLDPIELLYKGTPADIAQAVNTAAAAGANAIWPGCDLWPEMPDENMRALMDAARSIKKESF